VTTSVAALLSLMLVLASQWARRHADAPTPQATHYRRLSRLFALAALAVGLLALWKVMDDHRRSPDPGATAPATRP
jgi:hypothetical protein